MTREIPLTRGYVALVDDADYEHLSQFKWHALCTKSGRVYAKRSVPIGSGKYRDVLMHRELLPVAPGMKVDHIEGIGLDNRRPNLRPATHQQNLCNRRGGNGASPFVGVARHKARWVAYITTHGRRQHLGLFDTAIEAAAARDEASRAQHGEFATINLTGARAMGAQEARRMGGDA